MRLFTEKRGNPKTAKNKAHSVILHLSPANRSGLEVCKYRTPGCSASCLNLAGRGGIGAPEINGIQLARIARTTKFFKERDKFYYDLYKDLELLEKQADKLGLPAAARLNGTSDIPWERVKPELFFEFSTIQFYDYTKYSNRLDLPDNYHLTFSLSETNKAQALDVLNRGQNIAAVFNTKKDQPLPSHCWGYPVFDADLDDERFLDPFGIAGLRAKGPAKKDLSGFVLNLDGTQRTAAACPQPIGDCSPYDLEYAGRASI